MTNEERLVSYIFDLSSAETPAELLLVIAREHYEISSISPIFKKIADVATSRAMYIIRPTPMDYMENEND